MYSIHYSSNKNIGYVWRCIEANLKSKNSTAPGPPPIHPFWNSPLHSTAFIQCYYKDEIMANSSRFLMLVFIILLIFISIKFVSNCLRLCKMCYVHSMRQQIKESDKMYSDSRCERTVQLSIQQGMKITHHLYNFISLKIIAWEIHHDI